MSITNSGFYYPNRIARIFLLAMEEIMGKNGLNAVLNMAKLSHLIGYYSSGRTSFVTVRSAALSVKKILKISTSR